MVFIRFKTFYKNTLSINNLRKTLHYSLKTALFNENLEFLNKNHKFFVFFNKIPASLYDLSQAVKFSKN